GETSRSITVPVIGDGLIEANETFVVNLSSPTNANLFRSQGVGTIVDNEPRISVSNLSAQEGNSGTKPFVFIATLSAASNVPVTAAYTTWNGDWNGAATAGSDYQPISGMLTFAPGVTALPMTVQVKGDRVSEPNEDFSLRFINPGSNEILFAGYATIV